MSNEEKIEVAEKRIIELETLIRCFDHYTEDMLQESSDWAYCLKQGSKSGFQEIAPYYPCRLIEIV